MSLYEGLSHSRGVIVIHSGPLLDRVILASRRSEGYRRAMEWEWAVLIALLAALGTFMSGLADLLALFKKTFLPF